MKMIVLVLPAEQHNNKAEYHPSNIGTGRQPTANYGNSKVEACFLSAHLPEEDSACAFGVLGCPWSRH